MGEYTDSLKLPEGSLATEIITDLCCLIILSTHQLRAEDPSLLGSTHTGCLKNPCSSSKGPMGTLTHKHVPPHRLTHTFGG